MHTLTYKHTHHAHRADLALRIYCGVEVSELITNKHQYPLIEREEKTWGGRGRGGGGAPHIRRTCTAAQCRRACMQDRLICLSERSHVAFLHFLYLHPQSLGDLTVSGSSSKFGVTEGNSEAVLPNLKEALRPTYVSTEHLDSKFEKHRYLLYVNLERERERERERELFKEFKEFVFDLRCNHFINFNIFYFLLHERAIALLPPLNALNFIL
jgi:hypothetical protein